MIQAPLTGKMALVTGASSGIGRAIALRLAADGATVAAHYNASAAHVDNLYVAFASKQFQNQQSDLQFCWGFGRTGRSKIAG